MSRALPSAMSALASARQDGWTVNQLDEDQIREMLQGRIKRLEALHKDALRRVAAERRMSREATSKRVVLVFHVGDYDLVSRPRKVKKPMFTWTDPCRVILQGENVCAAGDLVVGQRLQVHMARM